MLELDGGAVLEQVLDVGLHAELESFLSEGFACEERV